MIDCLMFVSFLLIFIHFHETNNNNINMKINNIKQRHINDVEIVSDITLDFELSALHCYNFFHIKIKINYLINNKNSKQKNFPCEKYKKKRNTK